jgi:hypothetical protein
MVTVPSPAARASAAILAAAEVETSFAERPAPAAPSPEEVRPAEKPGTVRPSVSRTAIGRAVAPLTARRGCSRSWSRFRLRKSSDSTAGPVTPRAADTSRYERP